MLTTVAIARRATSWRLRRGGRGASLSTTAPAGAPADLQGLSAVCDQLLEPPTTLEQKMDRIVADEAALTKRWEISLPESEWTRSRDELLASWGTYFLHRGLLPASLASGQSGRTGEAEGGSEEARRLLTLLSAAYTGPLTVAQAIHELVLPKMDALEAAAAADRQHEDGAHNPSGRAGRTSRPRAGVSNRKGGTLHLRPHGRSSSPAPAPARRQVEVHIVGAASQEESLLQYYWPELGLLFPHLSMRVTLVGPELSPKSIFSKNLTLADNMTASLHSEDYDSFRRKRSLLKSYREPDLLVAFNPGFGTDRADWLPTLEGLLREKGKAALVSTSFDQRMPPRTSSCCAASGGTLPSEERMHLGLVCLSGRAMMSRGSFAAMLSSTTPRVDRRTKPFVVVASGSQ